MKPRAYYNEFDPKAAAWLRELIRQGHIAPGDVDERSISDVLPSDLDGYTQCHFFAGIGVWSYALRQAGWPDDRPVWTGSCPCQPFSSAGQRKGKADERHLWPHWQWLVAQHRPVEIFGEQVASKDGRSWFDLVSSDLEGMGYATGAVDLCAAGVGAPHIRQRLWFYARNHLGEWDVAFRNIGRDRERGAFGHIANVKWREYDQTLNVADTDCAGSQGRRECRHSAGERVAWSHGVAHRMAHDDDDDRRDTSPIGQLHDAEHHSEPRGETSRMGDAERHLPGWLPGEASGTKTSRGGVEEPGNHGSVDAGQCPSRMAHDNRSARDEGCAVTSRGDHGSHAESGCGSGGNISDHTPHPTNGFWRDADWLGCRDGKFRPVRPCTQPLADGSPARVGRLRGYGNAIVAPAAVAFIEATQGW